MENEERKNVVFEGDSNDVATLRSKVVEQREPFLIQIVLATKVVKTPAQAKLVLIFFVLFSLAITSYLLANLGPTSLPPNIESLEEDI
jgi:hypothetical protein